MPTSTDLTRAPSRSGLIHQIESLRGILRATYDLDSVVAFDEVDGPYLQLEHPKLDLRWEAEGRDWWLINMDTGYQAKVEPRGFGDVALAAGTVRTLLESACWEGLQG